MKPQILLVLCCAIMAFAGCEKYEVQFEGPYNDDNNPGALPAPHEIVFAQEGEIWMLDSNFSRPKNLRTGLGQVELVSINFAHDQIAYKVAGEDIKIMDTEGVEISAVSNSKNVTWFDWHQNGKTLYMLDGMTIKFHGPTVSVPLTNLNFLFPGGSQERSVSCLGVTPNGWLVFNYRWYANPDYISRIRVVRNTNPHTSLELNVNPNREVHLLRLLENGSNAVIGFREGSTSIINLVNISTGNNVAFTDAQQVAIRPSGLDLALWKDGRIVSFNDETIGQDVGSGEVTSMDW